MRPLELVAASMRAACEGQVGGKVDIESEDEFGQLAHSYNQMIDLIVYLVRQTHEASRRLSLSSSEILSATEQQASGAAEQAASISQTTATMEELAATYRQIADNANFLQPLIERYTGLSEVMAGSEVPLSLLVLATTIVGPLAEELVYRGAVMGAFRAVMSDRWAIVLSALIFGIVHMDVIQGTYAFVLGLILGYLYMKTRNIWCAYLMHMILNFLGGPLTKILGADQDPVKAMVLVLGLFLVGIVGIVMVVVNNGKQKREAYLRQQHDAVSNEHQS